MTRRNLSYMRRRILADRKREGCKLEAFLAGIIAAGLIAVPAVGFAAGLVATWC